VGDILRLREPGHEGDRGVLVEVEELSEVEFYLEHNELLQVMTFDRSAKATMWVVCYENPKYKIEWLGDGTNVEVDV